MCTYIKQFYNFIVLRTIWQMLIAKTRDFSNPPINFLHLSRLIPPHQLEFQVFHKNLMCCVWIGDKIHVLFLFIFIFFRFYSFSYSFLPRFRNITIVFNYFNIFFLLNPSWSTHIKFSCFIPFIFFDNYFCYFCYLWITRVPYKFYILPFRYRML
jgi:hypothetical protein